MTKSLFLITLLLVFLKYINFQDSKWILKKKISTNAIVLNTDSQNNIYGISETGAIIRYDSLLIKNGNFSLNLLNIPSFIETWNRLNVMVFYEESQQLFFLDRFMQLRNEFDLRSFDNAYFTAIATSPSGSLWAFDSSNLRLMRISPLNSEVLFDWFLNDLDYYPEIIFLRELNNYLFSLDANKGIMIYDLVGNLIQEIDIDGAKSVNFDNKTMYYLSEKGKSLHLIDFDNNNEREKINLPEEMKSVVMSANKLFGLNKKGELCLYERMN